MDIQTVITVALVLGALSNIAAIAMVSTRDWSAIILLKAVPIVYLVFVAIYVAKIWVL